MTESKTTKKTYLINPSFIKNDDDDIIKSTLYCYSKNIERYICFEESRIEYDKLVESTNSYHKEIINLFIINQ